MTNVAEEECDDDIIAKTSTDYKYKSNKQLK